ncbi:hypothetical protein M9458_037955 [Cirrhinus mrigala]|uniref:Uncharacterized protein n=1 Tax=Cirrhinus mrigala TaxID=683832 RepID=A0ABD0NYJ9_CIRMR
MKIRWSKKVAVLAKVCFLFSLLWLFYLLIVRSSSSSHPDKDGQQDILVRDLPSVEEVEEDSESLLRPVYEKQPPDSNAPGEYGRATRLTLSPEEKKEEEASIERYAINIFISDKISLHRHIQDNRMHEYVCHTLPHTDGHITHPISALETT